ncbi:MAG: integration host factor subunit beta [Deltaproteobacteria bacterium]|nr:integration host factor subunit beta [Deltaproteobacteria bacterium]
MTKSELIETVANKLRLPKGKAELIVNCVFDSMESALRQGERIEIRGFGSFEIRHYKAYEGRNPRTGAKVEVRPKRLPFFKVGKELKERVNAGAGTPLPPDDDDDDDDDDIEEMSSSSSMGTPSPNPAPTGTPDSF